MHPIAKLLLPGVLCLVLSIFVTNSYSQACIYGGTVSNRVAYEPAIPQSNLTINGLRIIAGGPNSCISVMNYSNVTISNCILGPSGNFGIYLKNCTNVTITNCSFMSNYGGVYAENCSGVKVDNNQFTNVVGGFPRGQFVQFNNVTGAGNEIKDNVGENVRKVGRDPQDLINVYKSAGTAASPLTISGNKLRGGSDSLTVGGILVGDQGGSYINVQNNILLNPGHFGIGIAGGNNINALNNTIYIYNNVIASGMYVWNQTVGGTCSNINVEGNQVDYDHNPALGETGYDGSHNSTCSSLGFSSNNWEASFGPGVLPDRLLCPWLVAQYKFNANWNDASGSNLNAIATNGAYGGQGMDFMCANFDGTARYLSLPSSPWLQAQSERFTISYWIKPWTLTGVQGIAQAQNSDGFYNGWRMILNGGVLTGRLVTDAGSVEINCGGITQGSWAHVVMVYDGHYLKGYVNGALQASAAITGNVTYPVANSPAKIGYCNGTNYLNAFLDEFKYYDGSFSNDDVWNDYTLNLQAVTNPQPETRLYYQFNNSWADGSGNGLTAATHSVGFVCNGADSRSANFVPGSYLTLPSSPLLNPFSSTFTVGCWIKPANVTGVKGIAQAQNSDGYNYGWRMLLLDGTFNARVVTNQGPAEVYCGGIQAGVWNYVAMVYDGLSLKGYVNGVLQSTSSWGGYINYNLASPRQMQIGLCDGANYYFSGYMDEFRFYEGAMNVTQIQQEYNTRYPLINATPSCPSSADPHAVNATAPVIEDAGDRAEGYVVRPNPAVDQLTITGSPAHAMLRVELYNALGQSVRTGYGSSDGLVLSVADLRAGVYLLRIYNGSAVVTRKVLVQR